MNQAKMEFKNQCIMDNLIWPDNDDWIYELKAVIDKNKIIPHNADI